MRREILEDYGWVLELLFFSGLLALILVALLAPWPSSAGSDAAACAESGGLWRYNASTSESWCDRCAWSKVACDPLTGQQVGVVRTERPPNVGVSLSLPLTMPEPGDVLRNIVDAPDPVGVWSVVGQPCDDDWIRECAANAAMACYRAGSRPNADNSLGTVEVQFTSTAMDKATCVPKCRGGILPNGPILPDCDNGDATPLTPCQRAGAVCDEGCPDRYDFHLCCRFHPMNPGCVE